MMASQLPLSNFTLESKSGVLQQVQAYCQAAKKDLHNPELCARSVPFLPRHNRNGLPKEQFFPSFSVLSTLLGGNWKLYHCLANLMMSLSSLA